MGKNEYLKNSPKSHPGGGGFLVKVSTWWLGAFIAFGCALRFAGLDSQSLWQDEALQFIAASANSFSMVIQRAFSGANPPLSHLINHLFLKTNESDFMLRLPSALFGVASLPIFYLIINRMVSKRAAFFAMLVFSFSPFHIWYSQDARPYSQLLFFSLLSTHMLFLALERRRIAWWAGYALSMIAGLASQVFMGFMLVTHFAWVAVYHRQHLKRYIGAAAVAMLPFIGLIPMFIHSYRVSIGGMDRPGFSLKELGYTFLTYSGGYSIGPIIADLHSDSSFQAIQPFWTDIALALLVFGGLLLFGILSQANKDQSRWLVLCLLGLCIPIAGSALYALGLRYNVRYTIIGFPFFCIIVGCGFAYLFQKHRLICAAWIVGFASITTVSLYNYYQNPYYEKENIRDAVAYWRQIPNTMPLISNQGTTVKRYLAEAEKEHFVPIKKYSDLMTTIDDFFVPPSNTSAFVLLARDWAGKLESRIRKRYRAISEQRFTGVVVLHLINTPRPAANKNT